MTWPHIHSARWWSILGLVAVALAAGGVQARQAAPAAQTARAAPAASSDELNAAIDKLGAFDFDTRTTAARTVRRAPTATAIPALAQAVRGHKDEYVRFKALVILACIGDLAARDVIREVIGDRNDRLRAVSYGWLEHHPDPALIPTLLAALGTEQSEFVRPALTRSLAAHGTDPRVRAALVPLVMRGEDFFRGAVIEALGDYKGDYALAEIIEVAKLDGPLQDDAITAIGKLGNTTHRPVLAAFQKAAAQELQPTISASLCLINVDCPQQMGYLKKTLTFSATSTGFQPLLRGAVHGMGMLAVRGNREALTALLDAGVPARDPARAPIALAVGLIAVRTPQAMLEAIEARPDFDATVELLRDAFDMLSEDYEEERFYVEIRRAFWAAPEGSARRRVTQTLLDKLEFS